MTRGAPIPDTVTLHVPFRFIKRGGLKEMHFPEGAAQPRRQHAGQGARTPSAESEAGVG